MCKKVQQARTLQPQAEVGFGGACVLESVPEVSTRVSSENTGLLFSVKALPPNRTSAEGFTFRAWIGYTICISCLIYSQIIQKNASANQRVLMPFSHEQSINSGDPMLDLGEVV